MVRRADATRGRPIVAFIQGQGAVAGIQLAHAGHKASTYRPWSGRGSVPVAEGGWPTVGPSSTGYPGYAAPTRPVDRRARRRRGGVRGRRPPRPGGGLRHRRGARRPRLPAPPVPLAAVQRPDRRATAATWPAAPGCCARSSPRCAPPGPRTGPLLVRISATDWVTGGHTLDDSVVVAGWLRELGVDLIDVSSGGVSPHQDITPGPGYQVPLAARIRQEAGIPTAAVGLITDPAQAEAILADGSADMVALARVAAARSAVAAARRPRARRRGRVAAAAAARPVHLTRAPRRSAGRSEGHAAASRRGPPADGSASGIANRAGQSAL